MMGSHFCVAPVDPERAQRLSLNQPPYLLHLTGSHEREGRESRGSVTLPWSRLIQPGLLALRYQGDWHLANASRRWRNR